ncbi:bolA-like protein 3 [Ctenocephalides felis]|uniref:bolA-like protein 3 n=1 Tax=Ctenocephalides felis TaxID=7515 RepID=UPI000E6E3051|nr:bolA-like protein 3 [Ctenocephalides felis]XP_026479857.1 bolA-like protein 3 [Ctenocephalides felis]
MFKSISNIRNQRNISILSRIWSGKKAESAVQSETEIKTILAKKFPNAKSIEVQDVSGGCGAMFEIAVEAADFKGMSTINQHRLITNTLKDQIKDMHGIRIQTSVPK